ncbi:MAG: CatB-related O-acetyltransferase [Alphaproteobacteria bacterium]|nr:CatB-related O-acetyltransferase [Alphaproteobacteria bacterium]
MSLFKPEIPHIGKCSYSYPDIYIANRKETVIGAFVSIGKGVRIGHGTHPQDYLSSSPYLYLDRLEYKTTKTPSHNEWEELKPIHIGNDVWIGDDVWIKNGVTIGDGAILGAHSLISKDVPAYAIMVGSPARVLRYRFSADIIERLLKTKWWNLSDEIIKQIPYDDINNALNFLENIKSNEGGK